MKVAVYTITKNEEQFIRRWAESAAEADYRVIVDTGSTDNTAIVAQDSGCQTHVIGVRPWRFDDARNASLALVPQDVEYCIALDADEILLPGWRDELEKLDPAMITRPRYKYTWSWNADGSPGLIYSGDKIHARHGYRWRHPVHETITPTLPETQSWCGLEIHHHPDNSKSRGQYLPLLELAVREDPSDDRNAHYLAREYYYQGRYALAEHEFKRHLALPKAVWKPERAKSMRLLARCVAESEKVTWLLRACAEDPNRREPWYDLGVHHYERQEWDSSLFALKRALAITERPMDYISEADAWSWKVYDYAAIAAYRCDLFTLAVRLGKEALKLNPDDERLQSNLKWYEDALV